ncbi:hypothetical protein Q7P37_001493 [Cladosporium fusiforme]
MPPQSALDPLDEIVLMECKGGLALRIHRKLLIENLHFLAKELLRFNRQIATGIYVLRTDISRSRFQRYAFRLYSSPTSKDFDASFTAPEVFRELSSPHNLAEKLQDENSCNDVIDAMISHLAEHSSKLADWSVWSGFAIDVETEALLKHIQGSDFHQEVTRTMLRKKEAEWEDALLPPYCTSVCCYHTHTSTVGQACGGLVKVEDVLI